MSVSLRPMDCSPPGSSVHGILQAGILEWAAVPSSGLPDPGINPTAPALAGVSTAKPPGGPAQRDGARLFKGPRRSSPRTRGAQDRPRTEARSGQQCSADTTHTQPHHAHRFPKEDIILSPDCNVQTLSEFSHPTGLPCGFNLMNSRL